MMVYMVPSNILLPKSEKDIRDDTRSVAGPTGGEYFVLPESEIIYNVIRPDIVYIDFKDDERAVLYPAGARGMKCPEEWPLSFIDPDARVSGLLKKYRLGEGRDEDAKNYASFAASLFDKNYNASIRYITVDPSRVFDPGMKAPDGESLCGVKYNENSKYLGKFFTVRASETETDKYGMRKVKVPYAGSRQDYSIGSRSPRPSCCIPSNMTGLDAPFKPYGDYNAR